MFIRSVSFELWSHNRQCCVVAVIERLKAVVVKVVVLNTATRHTFLGNAWFKQASIFICPINKQRYNIDE